MSLEPIVVMALMACSPPSITRLDGWALPATTCRSRWIRSDGHRPTARDAGRLPDKMPGNQGVQDDEDDTREEEEEGERSAIVKFGPILLPLRPAGRLGRFRLVVLRQTDDRTKHIKKTTQWTLLSINCAINSSNYHKDPSPRSGSKESESNEEPPTESKQTIDSLRSPTIQELGKKIIRMTI